MSSISNLLGWSLCPFPSGLCICVETRRTSSFPVSKMAVWDSDLGNFHRRCRQRRWCSTHAHCRAWGRPLRCTRGQLPSFASQFLPPSGSSGTVLHWKCHREQRNSVGCYFPWLCPAPSSGNGDYFWEKDFPNFSLKHQLAEVTDSILLRLWEYKPKCHSESLCILWKFYVNFSFYSIINLFLFPIEANYFLNLWVK